jgi:8-oxo-dGTP diphosphatase
VADRTSGLATVDHQARSREEADHLFRVRRGAKALVTCSDRLLLVRERHADGTPFWTLPGGGAYRDESLADALRREMAEELRCRCTVGKPLDSFWYVHRSLARTASLYTVFGCALGSRPSPVPDEGVEATRWVEPAVPPSRTLPAVRTLLDWVSGQPDTTRI